MLRAIASLDQWLSGLSAEERLVELDGLGEALRELGVVVDAARLSTVADLVESRGLARVSREFGLAEDEVLAFLAHVTGWPQSR
ncbi:hypothetical protein [Nocardioides sp. R-C-SC26]|uniref:hypothetical protein n=1 Tax=Nocardioides sp. R-C-SC26 TaxID=2870414 RepID=UPI001E56E715|nr:hypothetical protein [Nocardioides sp. R-C-SC26]